MWISPKDYKIVGDRLTEAREAANLTQQQVAKLLRKPQSFVSACESGQRRVDLLELARIAQALGANPRLICSDVFDRMPLPKKAR